MEPVLRVKEVQGYPWTDVGGMGQRMAVFYSPQADAGGNHYFAVIAVDDYGYAPWEADNHPYKKKDDRFYLVWAVSNNGIDWYFEKKYPNFSNCSDTNLYLIEESTDAREFIYRYCFQRDGYLDIDPKLGTFHHYALYYSDPNKTDIYGQQGDGYLYVILGYTPAGAGINNIAIRIKMNFSSCIGRDLNQPIQIYKDTNSFYCSGESSWQNLSFCDCPNGYIEDSDFPGCISLNFSQDFRSSLFNKFIPGIAVPFDWITLKDRWGNFYGSVIVYDSEHTFGTDRIAIRFTRDIKPPFRWTEERELNTCSISSIYSTCEAGGNNVGLYQPPYSPGWYDYYDSQTGAPKKLIAYFGFTKHDCKAGTDCTVEPAGILPATIDLTNYTTLPEIRELKITKAEGGKLQITWIPQGELKGMKYLKGCLEDLKEEIIYLIVIHLIQMDIQVAHPVLRQ